MTIASPTVPGPSWSNLMQTPIPSHKAYIVGDSIAGNNWATTGTPVNFKAINLEGVHEWANALLGQRFQIAGNSGSGGKTAEQILDAQLGQSVYAAPGYVFLSAGTNDLYNSPPQTGLVTFNRIKALVQSYLAAGIIPIWSTILPRTKPSTNGAAYVAQLLDCNDRLRQWAMSDDVGIFWDGFSVLVDPTNADCNPRSGYTYDTSPAIHPNNVGAYYLGKKLAAAINSYVTTRSVLAYGAEDQTNTSATNGGTASNVLVNPMFTGTGGTVSANCTGTMPDSWTIEWATRTGTGSAAAAIVNVTDPDSGLATAKGIQITISGAPAANDEIRVKQSTGFNTLLTGGSSVQAEAKMSLATPAAIDRPRLLLLVNNTEQTNWGNLAQVSGSGALTDACTFTMKTRDLTVLGTGAASAADFQARVRFNGDGVGTVITISNPRVRKF